MPYFDHFALAFGPSLTDSPPRLHWILLLLGSEQKVCYERT